jgi:SagB-type dehydrogenase family enzyme
MITSPVQALPEWLDIALEEAREELDVARRAGFSAFGVPMDCYWPAARVYHQHSSMGPETKFRLTLAEVEAFTRNPDYKRYPGATRISLPRTEPLTASLEDTVRRRQSKRTFSNEPVPLHALAKLLEFGCGVTAQQEIPRRAAPSPGGLYAVEAYPLTFSVAGLAPGIYHYAATEHVLERVSLLQDASALKPFFPPDLSAALPPLVIALSVVFPRVQTKYIERGYRFALLEAGHVAQNMLLAATALGMNSVPVGGFWDDPFNDLIGFHPEHEAVVYSIIAGGAS